MLADRVAQAVALWRAGKVDRILVSGDHGSWSYDEPDTMRKALLRAGVPARDIFTDHAGFDTWDTMVRARRVFGVTEAIVVTQGFHMARALYLGREAGLKVSGLTADLHSYGYQGKKSDVRELFARVKAVKDAITHPGVLLGSKIPITGDGRLSWGPKKPPTGRAAGRAPGPCYHRAARCPRTSCGRWRYSRADAGQLVNALERLATRLTVPQARCQAI